MKLIKLLKRLKMIFIANTVKFFKILQTFGIKIYNLYW